MESVPQKVLSWLHRVLSSEYVNLNRAYTDIARVLGEHKTLRPSTEVYTFENGRSALLLHITGTIPVTFRSATYSFPISLWIPQQYPSEAPFTFVAPTKDMMVRPGQHVSGEGRVYHPYLASWRPDVSNISELVRILQDIFSREPPLVKRQDGRSGGTQEQRPGGAPPVPPLPPELSRNQAQSQSPAASPQPAQPPPPPPRPGNEQQQGSYAHSNGSQGQPTPPPKRISSLPPQTGPPQPPPRPPQESRYTSPPPLPPAAQAMQPSSQPPASYGQGHPQSYDPAQQRFSMSPPAPNLNQSLPYRGSWQPPPPTQAPNPQMYQQQPPPGGQYQHPPAHPAPAYQPPPKPKEPPPDLLSSQFDAPLPTTEPIPAPPIPPNPEKDALLQALSRTLTAQLHSTLTQNGAALASLHAQHSAMQGALVKLQAEQAALAQLDAAIAGNERLLREAAREADATAADARRREPPGVDEALVAPTVVGQQLYALVAELRASEEAREVLLKALGKGRIAPEVWIKQTRQLAREEFMKKVLARKIAVGMGLRVESE